MFPEINFCNSDIKKAGKMLVNGNSNLEEVQKAEEIINEWRKYHFWPIMTIQGTLRNHVRRMSDTQSIVVQRLKKMQTIKDKLKRNPTMRLHKMQDVGGCRAIFSNCDYVYELYKRLHSSSMKHVIINERNYIEKPHPTGSGYRGIHLILQYNSKKYVSYNGFNIEIQIRTYLQHLWATAVETVGTFTNYALKSSIGPELWIRYFQLMSSLIALEENCNIMCNTPTSKKDIIAELKILDKTYSIFERLSTINASCDYLKDLKLNRNYYYLLIIANSGKEIKVIRHRKFETANAKYIKAEKNVQNNAVLVSATSFDALRKAYPNYFMNISEFLGMAKELMLGDNL